MRVGYQHQAALSKDDVFCLSVWIRFCSPCESPRPHVLSGGRGAACKHRSPTPPPPRPSPLGCGAQPRPGGLAQGFAFAAEAGEGETGRRHSWVPRATHGFIPGVVGMLLLDTPCGIVTREVTPVLRLGENRSRGRETLRLGGDSRWSQDALSTFPFPGQPAGKSWPRCCLGCVPAPMCGSLDWTTQDSLHKR